jgi:hypothetical protein
MGVTTQRYVRKPLFVDAVRVRENNFEEIAAWCQGEITKEVRGSGSPKPCIRVQVQYPKNLRQTLAFDGDWILCTDRGYKVYTNKAFKLAFDLTDEQPKTAEPQPATPDGRDPAGASPAPVAEEPERPATAEEIRAALPDAQDRRPAEVPPVETVVDEHTTPQGEPHEYVEATPEAIAEAVEEQQPQAEEPVQSAEELAEEMRANEAERARVAAEAEEGVTVSDSPSAPPVQPPEVAPEPVRTEPVSEQPPEVAAAGKQVLSHDEQRRMGPERVRELVSSGEAVLAQDLA